MGSGGGIGVGNADECWDASDVPGTMNVTNDLQFDSESSKYYLKNDKTDLDNARNNLHWEGDFSAGLQKIEDIENKGKNTSSVTQPPANAEAT